MLDVKNLNIRYGAVHAVRDVSLHVQAGTAVALIGSNGAGKSSVIKGILGLAPADGQVFLAGHDVSTLPTHRRVAAGVALSPEGRHVFGGMSVVDNLEVGCRGATPLVRGELVEEMFGLFPRLKERKEQLAGSLSGGEQQMVAIARALMSRPKLLMLDEPTLGLAPIVIEQLIELIAKLKAKGLAILLAEQNAEMALEASDRAYVLETGTLKRTGDSRTLATDPAIKEDYLGF